ncbi:unnamed protein product, partial [Ilex paraguariensis]
MVNLGQGNDNKGVESVFIPQVRSLHAVGCMNGCGGLSTPTCFHVYREKKILEVQIAKVLPGGGIQPRFKATDSI